MSTQQVQGNAGLEESFDSIVIGGGQAGLAVGHFLAQQGQRFLILDKNSRTGDAWRCRWESLRLFTPSQFDGLPGMPFPKPKNYFPTKDEVADYLEAYARHFDLPVRHNVQVERVSRSGQGYAVATQNAVLQTRNVIVATGPFQRPFIPAFSSAIGRDILQLHSSAYFNPQQIAANSVLVVGAGNSGAEIALELSKAGKKVWLSGRDVGRLPSNSPLSKILDGRPLWWFMTHVLTVDTPIGRKMQAGASHGGAPLGRARREEIAAEGVMLTARTAGVEEGKPKLEDGQILPADGVIWATGFQPDYHWIDVPVFDEQGYPQHERGAARGASGLYFIGLPFQTGLSSPLLGGVGKDAATIAGQVARNID